MMVHECVVTVIHDEHDDDSDYEDGCEEEDEEAGQLQSGFKAMDITRATQEEGGIGGGGSVNEDGEMIAADGGEIGTGRTIIIYGHGAKDARGKNPRKIKHKRKKNRGRRKQSGLREQSMSIERFVVQTCRRIKEPKFPLFREAVDRIGIDAMEALLNQVDVIEKCGGQMTADGVRRRSAGGVLWNLLRDLVGPRLYKEIMKEGNRKHIEQQKARFKERENEIGNGKRHHPNVDTEQDEPQSVKRRRISMDIDDPCTATSLSGRSVSGDRHPITSLREEADNVRTPAALQNAWVQGLKKQSERATLNPTPSEGNLILVGQADQTGTKRPVSERIRMTVSYGDLVEEGQTATDSPIYEITEIGSPNPGVEESNDIREEGEIAD